MPAPRLPAPDEWPSWALVDRDLLSTAQDERPYLETAAALVTEFGELTALLARTSEQPDGSPVRQGRNQAVLSGLTTRIVKLTRRLAAETYEGRGELQLLIDREIFTSTAALAYLLRGRSDRFDAFVRDSLHADRDVWQHLNNNRDLRAGDNLPPGTRVGRRLERSFGLAGLDPAEFGLDEESGWPDVRGQVDAIGEPDAYRMHQLGADEVHGTWNELVTHHLRTDDDDLVWLGPKLGWSPAVVQPLTAVAIQGSRVMAAYARHLGYEVAEAFRDKYLDLAGRAALTDRMHEEYLERVDINLEMGNLGIVDDD
ncbi:MAG: hypothetical protein F4Y98_02010 [Chloroflexi bacterium]|nr:hypothetical protein [Chloroflexota bacterium]